jgi:hypothetical protein
MLDRLVVIPLDAARKRPKPDSTSPQLARTEGSSG